MTDPRPACASQWQLTPTSTSSDVNGNQVGAISETKDRPKQGQSPRAVRRAASLLGTRVDNALSVWVSRHSYPDISPAETVAVSTFGPSSRGFPHPVHTTQTVVHTHLWRTRFASHDQRLTFSGEGHPRGNGDGPLTTIRSLKTKGGLT